MTPDLLLKYDIPAPRYTSYPTVPDWDLIPPASSAWKEAVRNTFETTNSSDGISLYVHLPFCERLCTYCGCNKRITKNHAVERIYMQAVKREWQRYLELFSSRPNLKEIHLGGGTPTFFSPEHLEELLMSLLQDSNIPAGHEYSFEAHPGNTNQEHLNALYRVGFRRISIGVQDFDPVVLDIINRIQTYEQVVELTESARRTGFSSVNYDLVYGLPLQQLDYFIQTIEKVSRLRPDRIAMYSYAHVPWIKRGQRRYSEKDLPKAADKMEMYKAACDRLLDAGYVRIGMDHFALPDDQLAIAAEKKALHRNFMGYTTNQTQLLVGLGNSAISEAGSAYVQNEKVVEDYYRALNERKFPFFKGHLLTPEDQVIRRHILNIMCQLRTDWSDAEMQTLEIGQALGFLRELEQDRLIDLQPNGLSVTREGQPFLRNICLALDRRFWAAKSETARFSQAI